MFQDRRIVTDLDHPPAVLAATDEIEAELVESIGYSLNWVRPVNGPGAVNDDQARACLNIPVAELETVLRTLATSQRLRFPASLGVLGRRAGGEMSLEDRELVALGLAVWYSYQRDDAIRHQVPKLQRMGERFDTQQQVPWETGETAESELDALISLVRNNQ